MLFKLNEKKEKKVQWGLLLLGFFLVAFCLFIFKISTDYLVFSKMLKNVF